jgi:type IV pilus assembly protein PilM
MFFHPYPNAFGIDIGNTSIKMVQLRSSAVLWTAPKYKLQCAREVRLAPGLFEQGRLEKPESVRRYLQKLLDNKSHKDVFIKSEWVVASLPDNQGFLKLLNIDKAADTIFEEDILSAASKHIPFDEDSFYFDWQVVSPAVGQGSTQVLVSAISKDIANSYTYLLDSVGLIPIALELKSLATARSIITAHKLYEGEARAILDLGSTQTTLIIYDHDHIQFVSNVPYSGELATSFVADGLRVPSDVAEQQKILNGLEYNKSKIWAILARANNELITQIEKSINFYYSHFPNTNKITHITMCGGGAAMKRLDKILTSKLKITSAPGHVWKNLDSDESKLPDNTRSLSYASAIGLALRAVQNPFTAKKIL